ncbi:hypothetical protein D9M68_556450 [compost metagenome]
MLVVDDQVSRAGGGLAHHAGGDLCINEPVSSGDVGRATVAGLEGAGREQLDGLACSLQLEGAGGDGGGLAGGFCLHAAMISGMRYLYKNEGVQ